MPPSKKTQPETRPLVRVTQYASLIRCTQDQRQTVIGLGLRRIGSVRDLVDTPSVRGMIAKVAHLVKVIPSA